MPRRLSGLFLFWTAATSLPLFFCSGAACHALRLRSLRVVRRHPPVGVSPRPALAPTGSGGSFLCGRRLPRPGRGVKPLSFLLLLAVSCRSRLLYPHS